jgi:hypothetical protein
MSPKSPLDRLAKLGLLALLLVISVPIAGIGVVFARDIHQDHMAFERIQPHLPVILLGNAWQEGHPDCYGTDDQFNCPALYVTFKSTAESEKSIVRYLTRLHATGLTSYEQEVDMLDTNHFMYQLRSWKDGDMRTVEVLEYDLLPNRTNGFTL